MGRFRIKRIYAEAGSDDGSRVLVDRLWPRGVARQTAALDLWLKDIAPSPSLRGWFAHDPARFQEFRKRYRAELDANPEAVAQLCALAKDGDVTLLYGARDPHVNQAAVLADYLAERGCRGDGPDGPSADPAP